MTDQTDGGGGGPGAPDRRRLYRETLAALAAAGFALLMANAFAAKLATLGLVAALISLAIYATVGFIVVSRILAFHPHGAFGWPNTVTLVRTGLAALIAGYTAEISLWTLAPSDGLAFVFAVLAGFAVALDGIDGWLARRIGPRSAFGARFDMESDALLILILSVLALVLSKAGIWVLAIGAMRYLFVGASFLWPWMERPLPASGRRKAICVAQGILLTILAMPVVTGLPASSIAALALALITWSFGADLWWLYRHRKDGSFSGGTASA